MEYVVKNKTLANNLSSLGFKFRIVPDRTNKQEFIYLFPNTDSLREAITFYTNFNNNK